MLKLMARNIGTLALAACFAVSGCVSSDGDDGSEPTVTDLTYQGATGPADTDGANSTALARAVVGTNASLNALPLRLGNTGHARYGIIAAGELLRVALTRQGPEVAVAGVHPFISVMEACDDGGEMIATTEGNRLTVEYFDCREGNVTINGAAQRVGSEDDNTVTIHGIRLTTPNLDLNFRGSFSFHDSGASETLTLTDLTIRDNHAGGHTLKTDNLTITETGVLGGDNVTINGRLFISEHGYIDVVTADGEPLFIADGDDYPSSGLLTLTGQHGETIVIRPLSSTQVNFKVDADGVMGAEIDKTVTWTEVEAAIGLS